MKILSTLFSFFILSSIIGQDCGSITASDVLVHGNMQFNILNGTNAFNELNYKIGIGANGDIDSREYAPIIYSNNIWAGAIDVNGATRLTAGKYLDQDWASGPLDEDGETNSVNCQNWDRVFTVTKEEILLARKIFLENGPCEDIPESVRNWPARGNQFSSFSINNNAADYFDTNGTATYDPCDGDLPAVSIRDKEHQSLEEYFSRLPKQISFYLMNDNGKPHYFSNGIPIALEVAVYVFTYETPQAEDIIFTKYKIRNYATENLKDFRFGSWFDFDLGCKTNDYLGTDLDRNMLYVYNHTDESDCPIDDKLLPSSQFGVSYLGGVYEPYLIVDNNGTDSLVITDSPWEVDTLIRTKMKTSIIPVNCQDTTIPNPCNPQNSNHYYNILLGKNKGGTPIFDNLGVETQIMYPDSPANIEGWSLCSHAQIPETTAIISSGSPVIQHGAGNEILLALCYTTDNADGCINPRAIQYKQEQAQQLYDDNFFNLNGPPPPSIEMSQSSNAITLSISDIPYEYSKHLPAAQGFVDDKYNFEGIKIYQVSSPNFDLTELENTDYSQLIYQGDIENDIAEIANWKAVFNLGTQTFSPLSKVNGNNIGIADQVIFDYDYLNDTPVVNGNPYYFVALSYAYNNYQDFLPNEETGQQYQYLEGKCGIKVLNSDEMVSNDNLNISKPYDFISNGQNWTLVNESDHLNVSLMTSNGQRIKSWNLSPNTSFQSYEVSGLNSGVYFLQVFSKTNQRNYAHIIVKIE